MTGERDPSLLVLYRRALLAGEHDLVQISFDATVLDRYRGRPGFSIVRTDSAGRLKKEGAFAIDFGIAPGDELVHVCLGDLLSSLPEGEREHWVGYVATPPLSRVFLQMRLHPGSCIEDGEVRAWD